MTPTALLPGHAEHPEPAGRAACVRLIFAMLFAALTAACHSPLARSRAGDHKTTGKRHVYTRPGLARQIALYLPNRVMDLFEIVAVPIGVGIDLGVDIRLTRWVQVAAIAGVGAGLQLDSRTHSPWVAAAEKSAAFGPWRTGDGRGHVASIDDWEIAIAGSGMKVGIDLAEIADFALGWFYIDILKDDYGWY